MITSRTGVDAFTDLVVTDPQLLRREFDDIIAAEFPRQHRPPRRRRVAVDRHPDPGNPGRSSYRTTRAAPAPPGGRPSPWTSQPSPPADRGSTTTRA